MKIRFFCPLWGSEKVPLERFCEEAAAAGYDGVEASVPVENPARSRQVVSAIKAAGLAWVAQHWETVDADADQHAKRFQERLEHLAGLEPLFINSQTGRDWFTFDQNRRMIDVARSVAERSGVSIVHETHRGKFSFCAQATFPFLNAYPDMRLTADFSHWCTVSESLLEDQAAAVEQAIARADHIHARVGYAEGPQVTDPRAPEWEVALNAHLAWWDRIVELHRASETGLTITPEFGPFPYMPQLPFTCQPVTDQWTVNRTMMNLLKNRYNASEKRR